MKYQFTNFAAWKEAVLARGLIVRVDPPSHEGMHEDDMWEPSFAVFPEEPDVELGMFANYPANDAGTEYASSGVLCDTSAEFLERMHAEDGNHWPDGEFDNHGQ